MRQLVVTKCDSYFITKCDKFYYKVRQVLQSVTVLLQSATGITKCDDYYKVRQNTPSVVLALLRACYFFSVNTGLWHRFAIRFVDNTVIGRQNIPHNRSIFFLGLNFSPIYSSPSLGINTTHIPKRQIPTTAFKDTAD